MKAAAVRELIDRDHWTVVEGAVPPGPYVLRYREPVLPPSQVSGYPRCLRVLWPYGAEHSGVLPNRQVSEKMRIFEDRLCAALEHDAVAVLTAVLTLDGARQWIFYTGDVTACGTRLGAMPQEESPYPIELDAFDDAAWEYLRDQVVRDRGPRPKIGRA